jgi:transposase
MDVRESAGRDASPTAGVIDSQAVKTTESGGPRGCAAEKMIKGSKRHILTDTTGLLVGMIVHPANVQDRDGAPARSRVCAAHLVAPCLCRRWRAGDKLKAAIEKLGDWTIEIGWEVERTFAWLNRKRRLAKDVEATRKPGDLALHRQRQADVMAPRGGLKTPRHGRENVKSIH